MHIYAWVVIATLGLIFLITGWSPFPLLMGGRTNSASIGKLIRLVGLCFVISAVLPIVGYKSIVSVLWISVLFLLIGFALFVVGMIKATSGKAI